MRNKEIQNLFSQRHHDLRKWVRGKIPKHFKRISITMKEAVELAKIGAAKMAAYYGVKLHFCQSVIAGAVLTGRFDEIIWVSPSQYGKTWLFGRLALILAYEGMPVFIAAATADKTGMMMAQVLRATQEVAPEVKHALIMKMDEIDRLTQSLSKKRIGFSNGGFVEPITLGDAYTDNLTASGAVGRSGVFFVDEAALPSEKSLVELDRRRFSDIDGKVYPIAMVSNPHKTGLFYDKLTQENVPEKTLVLWMDALTAVEEERWTEEKFYDSDFARDKSSLRRYILCVLDTDGNGMFDTPTICDDPIEDEYAMRFLGIDSAYKGKDNLDICMATAYEKDGQTRVRIEEVITVDKRFWTDGKTSEDIISDIRRIIRNQNIAFTCIDIGQGIWLVEGLANKGENIRGINFQSQPTKERVRARHYSAVNAYNKRAEMHLDLQNLIEDDAIEFSTQAWDTVKDTFPFVSCERKANGKILIASKPQIKALIGRSPDELDSVILALHAMITFMGESIECIT